MVKYLVKELKLNEESAKVKDINDVITGLLPLAAFGLVWLISVLG